MVLNCGHNARRLWRVRLGSAALFDNPFSVVFHYPSNSLFVYDSGDVVLRRIQ